MHLLGNFCWAEIRSIADPTPRPCLFLDRDGVVIVDRHHLADPAQVELLPGAADIIAAANLAGWVVGLVTNQSGIGRGLFGWSDFALVQAKLESEIRTAGGGVFDFVCACPHHGGGKAPFDVADHSWRKPNPGMILHAAHMLNIDLARSVMVGDRSSDMCAAGRAGVGRSFLVGALQGEDEAARAAGATFERARDLAQLLPLLLTDAAKS